MLLPSSRRACGLRASACFLIASIGMMAAPARAQSVTFANFTQVDPGVQSFVGTNNGGTSFSISTAATPVNFSFSTSAIPGLPAGLQGIQSANEVITGTATTTPASVDGNGQITQGFNAIETIQFIRSTPYAGLTNLLTVTFSASSSGLSGARGATAAGLNASTSSGDTITFTSDFLNFSNTTVRGLSLSLTSINPVLSIGPGGFINSFAASQSGNFSSTPPPSIPVPVPPSVVLLGLGLLGAMTFARVPFRRPTLTA